MISRPPLFLFLFAPTERERAVAAGVAPPSPPHVDDAMPPLGKRKRAKSLLKEAFG
jgi:hypothetical protein